MFQEIGSRDIDNAICGLEALAVKRGEVARGARLLGAAMGARELTWRILVEWADDESSLAAARGILGEEAFQRAWAQGRAMTREHAITDALAEGTWRA